MLYKSIDGGNNWLSSYGMGGSNPLPFVEPVLGFVIHSYGSTAAISIHPNHSKVVYASGQWGFDYVYFSTNNGDVWFPLGSLEDRHVRETVVTTQSGTLVIFANALEGLYKYTEPDINTGLDQVVVNPNNAFVVVSGTQQFTASAYDQNNNLISGLSFTWSVINDGGSIDASGLFTAGQTNGIFPNTVQAQASYGGNTRQATATVVVGATLAVTATLQGGSRPLAGMNIPLAVKLYDPGTTLDSGNICAAIPLHTATKAQGAITITASNTSNKTITFQVDGLPIGTFNVALCSPHCLINLKNGVQITAQGASLNMGTLFEGNADDSEQIAGADFSLLLNDYLQMYTGPKWNGGRCDFDCDGQVTAVDFSLIMLNYNQTSPQVLE